MQQSVKALQLCFCATWSVYLSTGLNVYRCERNQILSMKLRSIPTSVLFDIYIVTETQCCLYLNIFTNEMILIHQDPCIFAWKRYNWLSTTVFATETDVMFWVLFLWESLTNVSHVEPTKLFEDKHKDLVYFCLSLSCCCWFIGFLLHFYIHCCLLNDL